MNDKENGEPFWRRIKDICNLLKKKKTDNNKFKLLNNLLTCLLFCKDYSNILFHGKKTINKYYYEKKDVKFFGSSMKELEEFKYINLLLLDKIKESKEQNDFDYHEYLTEDGLNLDEVIAEFENAVNWKHLNLIIFINNI